MAPVRTPRNRWIEEGLLASEDEQTITLKTENDVAKVIPRKEVETVEVSDRSVMPEGLANAMSAQDFRDLVRYLMANPFVTEAVLSAALRAQSGVTPGPTAWMRCLIRRFDRR